MVFKIDGISAKLGYTSNGEINTPSTNVRF